ncbi:hypothetical protein ACYSNW_12940 [Enterococcus sp. LJL99]
MNAIEKIVEEIIENGKQDTNKWEEERMKGIKNSFEIEKEALLIEEAKQIEKNQKQLTLSLNQKRNRQQLETRQELLNKKQFYLEQLFSEVVTRMNHWSIESFQSFAKQIIVDLPLEGEIMVYLGEFSKEKVTQKWFLDQKNEQKQFILCDEVISGEGGLLFSKNGVEYNCLFSNLVEEIKKAESFNVAEKLFQSEVLNEDSLI